MPEIRRTPDFILRLMTAVDQIAAVLEPTYKFGIAHNNINSQRAVSYFGRQGPSLHVFTAIVEHELGGGDSITVDFVETDIRDENEGDTSKYLMRAIFYAGDSFGIANVERRFEKRTVEVTDLAQSMALFLTSGTLDDTVKEAEVPKH